MYQPQYSNQPTPPRAGMSSGQRTALLTLALVVVFALGFVAGIVADRYAFPARQAVASVPLGIATNTPLAAAGLPKATASPDANATPNISGDATDKAMNGPQPTAEAGAVQPGDPSTGSGDKQLDEQMKTFWEAWQLVEKEYYGRPVDRQKMIYGATKGMMDALGDPYTTFANPAQTTSINSDLKGQFDGIGVYIDAKNDKQIVVLYPIEGSPAEKAGIKAGDIFIKVNGESIVGQPQDVVISKIKGPRGTAVTLTVQRVGVEKPFDVTVTRDAIRVASTTGKLLDGNILYLKVTIFGDQTVQELDEQLAKYPNPSGIILDLRNNGGGYVTAAQQMLGRFLPNGVALYEKFSKSGTSGDDAKNIIKGVFSDEKTKMVVLINGGSASASEITAGALQDAGRATLIGEKSYGKGSEQYVHTLSDNSSARVTVAHWLTPKKREINGIGLQPDIPVKLPVVDPNATPTPGPTVDSQSTKLADQDVQTTRAVEFLTTGK